MKPSLTRNVATSWAVTASGVVYALFVTPVVVSALGQQQYGVWSFLSGLIGYSSLLYLGVGSALVRYLATYRARHDQASINRLTSVAMTIFIGLGGIALLVFSGLSPFVPGFLAGALSPETARAATITCVLLGVQLLCLFPTSAFMATLMGRDRFDLVNLAHLGTILIRFLLVGPVVQGSYPLVRLAAFMAATNLAELLVARALAHRVDPSLRVAVTTPRAAELRILYGVGIPAFLITFSLRLISYTDTTVVGAVLGAASVAIYALPLQIIEYIRFAVTGFAGALLARITVLHASGEKAALRRVYLLNLRVASLIASFLLANVMWLGVPFLNLWVGPTFGEPARWVIVWLSLATFLHVFTTLAALPFYTSMQILRLPANVLMLEAILNLVLSITMARRLGVSGVALATLIPAAVSFAVLPRWLARTLSVPAGTWVRSAMLPPVVLGITVSAAQWLMSLWIDPSSFQALALRAIGTLPGAILVALAMASREERADVFARLRRSRSGEPSDRMSAPNDPA
jgi:O-antigen/teichoic acid export membrane protein